jgi:acyl carrier protein
MTTLREELLAELSQWGTREVGPLHDDASLIVSGLVDSVGLFQMLLWIEEKVGTTIDPGTVDWRRDWDSIGAILHYIEQRRVQRPGNA